MAQEFHENIPRKLPIFTFFPSVFMTRLKQDVSYPISGAAASKIDAMKYFIATSEAAEGSPVSTGVVCEIYERKQGARHVSFTVRTLFQVSFDLAAGEMRNGLLYVSWSPFRLHPISVVDMQTIELNISIRALIQLFQKFVQVLEEHESEHRLLLDSESVKLASQNILRGINLNKLDRTLHCVMDAIAMLFTKNAKGEGEALDADKKQFFHSAASDFLHQHFVKDRLSIVLVVLHQLVGDALKADGMNQPSIQGLSFGAARGSGATKDYKARFEAIKRHIPEAKWAQIEREIMYAGGQDSNAHVSKKYLDQVLWMPWGVYTEDTKELADVQHMLDEDHAGLSKVKDQILQFLAVRQMNLKAKGPILCLVGPPGVGKTSLGRSIARSLGRKFARMALGGVRDEGDLRGHRRTYIGAIPGKIVTMIQDAGSFNPVIQLDEGDKVGLHFGHSDVASALLEILDPEQNFCFEDHYLEVPTDLSSVFFLVTANLADEMMPALRDRMKIIWLPGYTPQEKLEIAVKHLVPKQRKECGIPIERDGRKLDVVFADGAISRLIHQYTAEAGVRELEMRIHEIFARIDQGFLMHRELGDTDGLLTVTPENLRAWCDKPLRRERLAPDILPPGVVTGLGVTNIGGETFQIEIVLDDEHHERKLKLTGIRASGDSNDSVNKIDESLKIAFGFFSSRGGILRDRIHELEKEKPLYVQGNLTEGGVPKDGPSAGVAISLALYGAITGQSAKPAIRTPALAATGEISLSGAVSAVGGIRDKVLAAHRGGIQVVIIPKENEDDIGEIPEDVRKELRIMPVSTIAESLKIAFPDNPALR